LLYLSLRLVHIGCMALWIGAIFFCSGDVRRTLASPEGNLDLLRERMSRSLKISASAGGLTVLSGIGLIVVLGGMGAVPVPIHIGLTVGFVMLGVGGGVVGRSWKAIDAALAAGGSRESVAPLVKRLAVGNGIFHGLWLLTLVLMVFRSGLG